MATQHRDPDPLEQRLRASLDQRADDVEPTPYLWRRVDEAVDRRRRWGLVRAAGLALGGAAAAVLVAVAVVPALTGTQVPEVADTPDGVPTAQPSPDGDDGAGAPDGGAAVSPTHLVTTDGRQIVLRTRDGAAVRTVVRYDSPEFEGTITWLAVRPGSTPQDLTLAFGVNVEGVGEIRWIRAGDDIDMPTQTLLGGYAPTSTTMGGSAPYAAWSPDGQYLAWVETQDASATGPRLRVIGWADGPGTDSTATDNTSFTLDGLELVEWEVEAWVWDQQPDGSSPTSGALFLGSAETYETVRVALERQGDGAIARPGTGGIDRVTDDAGAIIEIDDRDGLADGSGTDLRLLASGDGSQDAEGVMWSLIWAGPEGDEATLALDLGPTASPSGAWMDAVGDLVVAGHGQAVVVQLSTGQVRPLDADAPVTYAALVPAG